MNEQTSEPEDFRARARARGELKNAEARAALRPLAPGERPTAVTVAAIAAMLLAIGNAAAYLLSDAAGGDGSAREIRQMVLVCGILVAASIGMWFRKYWAVLGFQTVLALQIIVYCLALTRINSAPVAVLIVGIIVASGALFWFLIRAMARIQMPDGPNQKALRERLDELDQQDADAGVPSNVPSSIPSKSEQTDG